MHVNHNMRKDMLNSRLRIIDKDQKKHEKRNIKKLQLTIRALQGLHPPPYPGGEARREGLIAIVSPRVSGNDWHVEESRRAKSA